ncbi:unnamed protein product [Cylicocyclus nassatus]|uniref:DUF4440 domain-containing protein n=1 Tax=Cylicocyclus nassatus TaxID=53992 RepID=A0AA36H5V5_CYLNA|nr:unnamed protein product [Cylicocyclus nassatus]
MSCCDKAKSIIHPILDQMWKDCDEGNHDKIKEYYHPDAFLIEVGKKGFYGRDAIKEEKLRFCEKIGKADKHNMKLSNEHYQMSDDYIFYCGESELKTEKAGTIKGKFHQIWRKTNGKWVLLREAWETNDI